MRLRTLLLLLTIVALAGTAPTSNAPLWAQGDDPPPQLQCLFNASSARPIQVQPGVGATVVGTIDPNRVYAVRGTALSDTGDRWYQIALSLTQSGWVRADGSQVAGRDCGLVPVLSPEFATPPPAPTATPDPAAATPTPAATQPDANPSSATPTATQTATATFPGSNCPLDFIGFLPTRFTPTSDTAQLVPGATLIVRTAPNVTAPSIGSLQAGAVDDVALVSGPSCTAGVVWWEVSATTPTDTVIGWVPESSVAANRYYLQPPALAEPTPDPAAPTAADDRDADMTPTPPRDFDTDAPVISTTNAATLQVVRTVDLDTSATAALATSTDHLAVIASEGVQVYDYPALTLNANLTDTLANRLPPTPGVDAVPTAIAFDQFGDYLVVGYSSGALSLLELEQGILIELRDGHRAPVTSISFDPDNRTMMTTSGTIPGLPGAATDFSVMLWDITTFDAAAGTVQVIYDVGIDQTAAVLNGTFTRSGVSVVRIVGGVLVLNDEGDVQARFALDEFATGTLGNLVAGPAAVFGDENTVLFSNDLDLDGTQFDAVTAWNVVTGISTERVFAATGRLPTIDRLPTDAGLLVRLGQLNDGMAALFVVAADADDTLATVPHDRPLYGVAFTADARALLLLDASGLRVLQAG